jgi:hypothetical protein
VSSTTLPISISTGCGRVSSDAYSDRSFSTDQEMPSAEGSGVDVLKTVTPPIFR